MRCYLTLGCIKELLFFKFPELSEIENLSLNLIFREVKSSDNIQFEFVNFPDFNLVNNLLAQACI